MLFILSSILNTPQDVLRSPKMSSRNPVVRIPQVKTTLLVYTANDFSPLCVETLEIIFRNWFQHFWHRHIDNTGQIQWVWWKCTKRCFVFSGRFGFDRCKILSCINTFLFVNIQPQAPGNISPKCNNFCFGEHFRITSVHKDPRLMYYPGVDKCLEILRKFVLKGFITD